MTESSAPELAVRRMAADEVGLIRAWADANLGKHDGPAFFAADPDGPRRRSASIPRTGPSNPKAGGWSKRSG
jgi:hypothetical protein